MKHKRLLVVGGVIVLLAVAGLAWKLIQESSAREAVLAGFERDFETEMQADRPQLDRLVARIRKTEGFDSEPRLMRILAKVYVHRTNAAKAWEILGPLATALSPDPEDALLGGRIQMELHRMQGGEGGRVALNLFANYAQGADDLLRGWLCASRVRDAEQMEALQARLSAEYEGGREERLVRVFTKWRSDRQISGRDLDELIADFEDDSFGPGGPVELGFLRATRAIQGKDFVVAADLARPLVVRAPELQDVREISATSLIALRSQRPLDSGDVARLRDHLAWLLEKGDLSDKQRETFLRVQSSVAPG